VSFGKNMAEIIKKLPPAVSGQIVGLSRELGRVDPGILRAQETEDAFKSWYEAMLEEARLTPQERAKRAIDDFRSKPRMRPNLSREPIPENLAGLADLSHWVWGDEMMTMALVFIAGKERFANILPDDFDRSTVIQSQSLLGSHAIYVMVVSSLYWALEEKAITWEQARGFAEKITDVYGFNDYITGFCTRDELQKTINHYHRTGYTYKVMNRGEDTEEMKLVREQLKDTPLVIREKLKHWLTQPLSLYTDFGRQIPEDEGMKRVREVNKEWAERRRRKNQ